MLWKSDFDLFNSTGIFLWVCQSSWDLLNLSVDRKASSECQHPYTLIILLLHCSYHLSLSYKWHFVTLLILYCEIKGKWVMLGRIAHLGAKAKDKSSKPETAQSQCPSFIWSFYFLYVCILFIFWGKIINIIILLQIIVMRSYCSLLIYEVK